MVCCIADPLAVVLARAGAGPLRPTCTVTPPGEGRCAPAGQPPCARWEESA